MRQQRTRTAPPTFNVFLQGVGGGMRSDRVVLSTTHSAECARGMSNLDGRRLGRGDQRLVREQDRFGLDLQHKPGRGGGPRRTNSEFPYCARKLAGHLVGHMREILALTPWKLPVVLDIPSVKIHNTVLLDHRFPLLVGLANNI